MKLPTLPNRKPTDQESVHKADPLQIWYWVHYGEGGNWITDIVIFDRYRRLFD